VNAISLYIEHGKDTFRSVHVEAAARVARSAAEAGVPRLVHVSGIGADAGSPSAYIRSRGEGEVAVLRAFAATTLIRPAVMFGPDDAFVAPLLSMLRLPATERIYELAGPQVYDYRSLLLVLGESLGKERLLLPVPFADGAAIAGGNTSPDQPWSRART
jgi:uncharacterized protein YbjT (DUF2867 family)